MIFKKIRKGKDYEIDKNKNISNKLLNIGIRIIQTSFC